MTSSKKPAILQVLPELNTGGVERGVVDLSIYANTKGYRVIVASQGGKQVVQLEHAGVEHFLLPLRTKNPLKIIVNILRLKKLIKRENVKLVHARSRAPAWSAYFAAKSSKVPFITTFHGYYKNNFPGKKIYNSVMAKGEKIIAVSDFIKRHITSYYGVDEGRITTIHRGVDFNEFDAGKISDTQIRAFKKTHDIENRTVILLPGRITRWKGQIIAVRALNYLEDKNAVLVFAGKLNEQNNYSIEIISELNDNGLMHRAKFLGDVNDMALVYAASDIVLSTSVEPETFGRVSAEANMMGKVVVATNIGGSKEIIVDGKTGFLVEAGQPKILAEKIDELLLLLKDEKIKQRMSEDCVLNVKNNFSLEKNVRRYFEII